MSEPQGAGPNQPGYRPDIDGLRALAILPVVAFHAWPSSAPGGFLGVDVFFVISGFLITSLLLAGLERGRFSIWTFYARRIRRIFPALIIVLLATFAIGWFLLLPDEYRLLGRHMAAGSLFSSNLLLLRESGYFDSAAEQKPLLHLWSLGVEEQFYLVWPLLLALLWRLKTWLVPAIAGIGAASLLANIWLSGTNPEAAFYLPVTRFWELLAGALLAAGALRSLSKAGPNAAGSLVSLAGFAVIAASLALLSRETPNAWRAIPVVAGTAMIVAAGPKGWLNRHILANPIVVYIGLISYALYLWHWPLLAFVRILEADGSLTNAGAMRAGAVAVAFVAAGLTHAAIERPVRANGSNRLAIGLAAAMLAPVALGVALHKTFGLAGPRGPWNVDLSSAAATSYTNTHAACVERFGGEFKPHYKTSGDFCQISGTADQARRLIIVGDSHASHLQWGLEQAGINSVMLGRGACLPLKGYHAISMQYHGDLGCLPTTVNLIRRAAEDATGTIVLHGYFSRPYDGRMRLVGGESIRELAAATFAELSPKVKRIAVVLDTPELPYPPSACMKRPFATAPSQPCEVSRAGYDAMRKLYEGDLRAAAAGFANVVVIDPTSAFCDATRCPGMAGGKLLYDDEHHLSAKGSELLGAYLKHALQ